MDSLGTVAMLRQASPSRAIYGLFVDYGQKAAREERRHARKIAREFGVSLEEASVSLPFWQDLPLLNEGIEIRISGDEGSGEEFTCGVPGRNSVILATLYAYVGAIGAGEVWVGFRNDTKISDQSSSFADAFEIAMERDFRRKVALVTPLSEMTKASLATWLEAHTIDPTLSWGCYESGYAHCGMCPGCVERKHGFREAKIVDPTLYGG
jgi:7-cyano-7-deazaguanine synthase in queuosine biosynthesis